ncbi:5-oxoprolinase subunit PxpA [Vibrio splendidus]
MLINCDMGESYGAWSLGQDAVVMPHIDMANIACGFHASDPVNMEKTVVLAKKYGTQIGAHPGYPDLLGFGRRSMDLTAQELQANICYQIGALQGICSLHDATVEYVKPHGALYNKMMKDLMVLKIVMLAVKQALPNAPLVVMATPQHDTIQQLAEDVGIKVLFEAFSDRAYSEQGLLVDRKIEGSTYNSVEKILAQITQILQTGTMTTINGNTLSLVVDTICIHGDGPHAAEIATQISEFSVGKQHAS